MSTRNPMNARNTGEGPAGKTRKSASAAKPAKSAAGTVYVKSKPTTKKEIKAAEDAARAEKQALERKRAEKAWDQEQKRLKKEAAARGEVYVEETLEEKEAREKEEAKQRKKEERKQKKEDRKARREQFDKEDKMALGRDMTAADEAEAYRAEKEKQSGDVKQSSKKKGQAKSKEEAAAQRASEIRDAKVRKSRSNYQTWRMIFYMLLIMTLLFSVMGFLADRGMLNLASSQATAYSASAMIMLIIGVIVYFAAVLPAERSLKKTETSSFRTASAKEKKHLAERQAEVDAKAAEKQIKRLKWTSKLPGSRGKQARELKKAIEEIDAEFDAAEAEKAAKKAAKAEAQKVTEAEVQEAAED